MKVIIHLPARGGSKRVPNKNLTPINGKPLIYYAAKAALSSNITNEIYINSDSDNILACADLFSGVKKYKRSMELASDSATSDEFNFDIIKKLNPDILIMINPICPFLKPTTIKDAFESFLEAKKDTLISCVNTQMQGFCDDVPINFDSTKELRPSQENKNISILNWAITIWDARAFQDRMNLNGFASLNGNKILYEIPHLEGIKISNFEDLQFVKELSGRLEN